MDDRNVLTDKSGCAASGVADGSNGTRLNFDAIVGGAGVGGLYAIHRLRKLGLKARAFEAAADLSGTWY